MDSNPILHLSPAKEMKCFIFWIMFNFLWLAGLVKWLEPHPPPSPANKMKSSFFIMFNFWCWPDWSMDSNPIHHPSPAKKMKCLFLDYIHFWWSAWLIDELEPHLPPIPSQKNEMLLFRLCSTSDDQPGWSMDSNPICHPSLVKEMKCSFLYYIQLLMLARLVNELEPHLPSLSSQKNEMLIFGLHSTSDHWLGWLMDLNSIHHPSPANKMKSSFLYYVKLLMIGRAGWWTRTQSTTPLHPKTCNACFCITFNIWCWPDWSMDTNPICHPSPAKKMKFSFLDYFQLLMTGRAGQWTRKKMKCLLLNYVHFWWSAWLIDELEPHLPPLSYQKNEMLNFRLRSTSDDQPSWSMDLNPICHPSAAKKMKCFFFGLHSNSDDWPGWVMDSNPIHHPSPAKKMKCSILDYIQLLMIGRAGRWTQTPSTTHLQPIKWNPQFCITLNFWWSTGLVDGLKPHLPTLSSQ